MDNLKVQSILKFKESGTRLSNTKPMSRITDSAQAADLD